ncbi:hypothetical protein [Ruegeria hyattellae]|uniref:hypothetical protein n=1 Tax=Ruegeria hyattellae TaxID=3233337 RepID=UPI00355B5844
MTKLSDKLADLSVRVGDIEARADAFKSEQKEKRELKVATMKADVQAQQDKLQTVVQSKSDEIASAWAALNQSMRDKATSVRKEFEAKKDAIDATHAEHRADRLEFNAALAIDFALVAMEDAELAVAEAIDARIQADVMNNAISD